MVVCTELKRDKYSRQSLEKNSLVTSSVSKEITRRNEFNIMTVGCLSPW